MKRVTLIAVFLLIAGLAGSAAQTIQNESDLYPKTVPIAKIYPLPDGYRIDYIRQDYTLGILWAPTEWFRSAASIGEIVYGNGPSYPYVTFFYKGGEVDHFRLYLVENPNHESWGSLDPTKDYSSNFPDPASKPQVSF